ncbi:MAG: hypothetical protein JWP30_117 [Homoserinimonas sp.]|jgi:predicted  nucleic acid-binding Zn-ribbon protein|nr:hypothetical protein [Homoserinimonas sp.]
MPLKASPDTQAHLLDLQASDTRIQQLDHRAKKLPEIAALASLAAEADQLRAQLLTETGAVEDARLELSRIESDVAVVESRMKRDTERIASSSSAKDVAGFEHELAGLTKRRDDLEEIELSVMERVEELESTAQTTRERLERVKESVATAKAERDAALASLASERTHAVANRNTIAGKLPQDLLALYERQRARYGLGASLLQYGVSSASGVKLNGNDLMAIRAAAPDEVVLCPDSQAILIRTAESGI